MSGPVSIENGFAVADTGLWLASRGQPAACLGDFAARRRKGLFVRDRARLSLVETAGRAWFADAARPFLALLPCAAPIFAVSSKVLLAPADAWSASELLRPIPYGARGAIAVTAFGGLREPSGEIGGNREPSGAAGGGFVVLATASRTARMAVSEGETLSVRPASLVAWTGNRPTGFCPRLRLRDVFLPRPPRDLLLHFHGPCVVWTEGAKAPGPAFARTPARPANLW